MIAPQTLRSPVPPEVAVELDRVVQRWRQLPLDRAMSNAGLARALVQSLADRVARSAGLQPSAVPDCGPATLMDQLTVLVYDASAADLTGAAARSGRISTLEQDLATLRRALS